jgi:hypothetical protein
LKAQLPTADESDRTEGQKSIAAVQQALSTLKNLGSSIETDPAWLRLVPNAAVKIKLDEKTNSVILENYTTEPIRLQNLKVTS